MSILKKRSEQLQLDFDSQYAELSRLQKMSAINEQNAKLEIAALESRNERLSSILEAETVLRKQSDEKANKFDASEPELQQLRREVRAQLHSID